MRRLLRVLMDAARSRQLVAVAPRRLRRVAVVLRPAARLRRAVDVEAAAVPPKVVAVKVAAAVA